MGILVDSTVFIAAERKGWSARQAFAEIATRFPDESLAISVITLAELAHGAVRADTLTRRASRQLFIHELMTVVPALPVTASAALKAGELDGSNQSRGIQLPLADLLIGCTALDAGYRVATGTCAISN